MPETSTIEEQRSQLETVLGKIKAKVFPLPKSCPEGTLDGLITWYFSDFKYDPDSGPYKAVDHAWAHTFWFKYSDIQKEALVMGGQYGICMVYTYLVFFTKLPAMEANGGLNMMYVHCIPLQELLEKA
ncbi:hypothetical protein K439DRAFT_1618261 [Ramaria rubella]|nr:hypothetical protein K439DRAFT_1618260 [Ramaria rubella]KAF8582446.1 hypothetical protein K439DRAFT_1618261 [Ramaria rubella]